MKFARCFIILAFLLPFVSGTAFAREMEDLPIVKLQSLDKITARTMTFEANVGNTVKFGSLFIKIQACRKAPPVEQPESAAFLQIWEVKTEGSPTITGEKPKGAPQWIFSGWMFSSSPALSHMDHPVYDVWVLDCMSAKGDKEEAVKPPADAVPGEGEIEAKEAPAVPDAQPAPAPDAPVESQELSPLGD